MDIKTLELDKVLNIVSEYAVCNITKDRILSLYPDTDLLEVEKVLKQTEEFRNTLVKLGNIPIDTLVDVKQSLDRCKKESLLYQDELFNISQVIETTNQLKVFRKRLADDKVSSEYLTQLIESTTYHSRLFSDIRKAIDLRGAIIDTASPELARIRKNIKNLEINIKEQLVDIIKNQKHKLNDTVISYKNERPTVLVKNEYKNTFRGIVWGESASGESTFIEPQEIVDLSSKITVLKQEEEREIYRILKELTSLVYAVVDELIYNFDLLLEIDFVTAKAVYANKIDAYMPKLNDKGIIKLYSAAHPLIPNNKIVRNNIIIESFQGLIITGPNTGGKTVTLKTTGLLTLMTQCGLLIPTAPNSEVAIFDKVFADIGDEQSIEQNLSTFSSHMKNIVRILDSLTTSSLVLLDELGSGTDPNEGANLAISIIDYLINRNARLIATTHYSKLKAYAFENDYVENASVEFDPISLAPTYKLLIGVPGRSNAYAISQSLGLSPKIIAHANSLTDENDNVSMLLEKIEKKSIELERILEENIKVNKDIVSKDLELDTKIKDLRDKEQKAIELATKEAKEIIAKAKEEADLLLMELKELKNKASIKEHELADAKSMYNKLHVESAAIEKANFKELEIGDMVQVLTYNKMGELVKKSGTKWTVKMGNLTLQVEESQLEFVKQSSRKSQVVFNNTAKVNKRVPLEIDLRGQRFDEARLNLEKYLDDCVVANNPRAMIIHGYGTGAIEKVVADVIKKNKHIISHRKGDFSEGGGGVTVVYFVE